MEGYARYVTIFCLWIYVMSDGLEDRPPAVSSRTSPSSFEERPQRDLKDRFANAALKERSLCSLEEHFA